MKTIVIVGGTFNPIHNGHLLAIQTLHDSGRFDEVWLMPSGTPPFKQEEIKSRTHRLQMCRMVASRLSYLHVCDKEVLDTQVSYTYKTWESLQKENPQSEFHWMIGFDHLFSIESWKYSDQLLNEVPLVLVNRGGYSNHKSEAKLVELVQKYSLRYQHIKMPTVQISSSVIRRRVEMDQSIIGYTPDFIIDYIRENHLYTEEA